MKNKPIRHTIHIASVIQRFNFGMSEGNPEYSGVLFRVLRSSFCTKTNSGPGLVRTIHFKIIAQFRMVGSINIYTNLGTVGRWRLRKCGQAGDQGLNDGESRPGKSCMKGLG